MGLQGNGTIPAVYSDRIILAKHAGMKVMELYEKNIRPRDIMTEAAFMNALTVDMALGCSTNSMLHLPAIANEFVVIIKESAVTYTIGVQDIMAVVQSVKGATYLIMEPLLVATGLYFCLCFPTSKLIAYFERRMSRGNKR